MEKCIKCGNEARWKSAVNISPLCNSCAVEEVDKLKACLIHPEEYAVGDFYDGIPTYKIENLAGSINLKSN